MVNRLKVVSLLFSLMAVSAVYGQASLSSQAGYTQTFNTLASTGTVGTLSPWSDNGTILGWYAYQGKTLPWGAPASYYLDDGSFNTGGAGLRSFGTTGQTDRALGEVSNGADTALFAMALRLVNNTGSALNSIMVSYRGEQWRQNSSVNGLVFSYQVGSTTIAAGTWTPVPALDFLPLKNGIAGALDGNAAGNYTVKTAIINLSIAAGQEIWLRWTKMGILSCGMAIDDVLIQAEPTSQATNLQFSSITATSMNLSFTGVSSASGYIVLQKADSDPTGVPVDGQVYNLRDAIGDATVVSFGSSTSLSATALLPSTSYHYAVYAYNGSGATTNYYAVNPLISSQNTLNSLASLNSDILAVSGSESSSISSLVNDASPLTSSTGKEVWKLTIRDGGNSGDSDSKPTIVTGITFDRGTNTGSNSWTNVFLAADLFDGTTRVGSGTISDKKISFPSILVTTPDNSSKTLSLRVSLKNSALLDNETVQFALSAFNVITQSDVTSSQFAAFSALTSDSTKNKITVVATKIKFTQQPTSVAIGKNIKPGVVIDAVDANNNIDLNYSTSVVITASGASLNGSPVTVLPLNGTAKFDSLSFSGTGNSVVLTASSGVWNIQSNSFSVVSFRTFYVDAALGNDAQNGLTALTAWKSLDKINATVFEPGDSILFKSGQTWTGQLKPKGTGASDNPIKISLYGGSAKPIISGGGVTGEAVLYLNNQEYWEISNLEITNDAATAGDRRGVLITAANYGVVNHIYLRNLYVHNIKGMIGDDDPSKRTAGIGIEVNGDLSLATRFNDVWVDSCTIANIENVGFYTDNTIKRNDYPNTPLWNNRKFTNLRVTNTVIHHTSKNAMAFRLLQGGLIEHNVCYETATGTTGNTIYTASCDGAIFQYNEGYYNRASQQGGDFGDGSMYDADLQTINCIFQYSYSHDNSHGLFWTCTAQADTGNICRYNVSKNDKKIIFCVNYPVTSLSIYNNTVYTASGLSPIYISERNTQAGTRAYSFFNNVIYNMSSSSQSYITASGYTRTVSNNIFYGYHPSKEPDDVNKLTVDPLFVNANPSFTTGLSSVNGFALKAGSPAIQSGIVIPGQAAVDFLGNSLPSDGIVCRGAFEYTTGTAVSDNEYKVNKYELSQNYPNPFNPSTEIKFTLAGASNVSLKIYNSMGQEVETLANRFYAAGSHSIRFEGSNLASGIYFYRLTSGNVVMTKKMILIK